MQPIRWVYVIGTANHRTGSYATRAKPRLKWPQRAFLAASVFVVVIAMAPLRVGAASYGYGGYSAVAAATGVQTTLEADGYLVTGNKIVDLGGPAAQALIDALGDSNGYAALPYPGADVVSAPGLANGAGLPVPVPYYPLIAQSRSPSAPRQTATFGPAKLDTQSQPDTTTASATVSATPAAGFDQSTATATLNPATGEVSALAKATVDAVNIDGLRLVQAVSSAAVSELPARPIAATSSFAATFIAASGAEIAVTDHGLVAGGTVTPLPSNSTLAGLLGASGVTVRYLAPTRSKTGTVSAGLEVTKTVVLPDAPGPGSVTFVVGRSSADVTPATPISTSGGTPSTFNGPPVATNPSASQGSSTAVPTTSTGAAISPTPIKASTAQPLSSPTSTRVQTTTSNTRPSQISLGSRRTLLPATNRSSAAFYLVLVVAAGVAFGGSQLIRLLGVRFP
jgi:hypothetical protein